MSTSWPNGGYRAQIHIPITKDVQEWTLKFVFDRPIELLEIWTPYVEWHSTTEFFTHSRVGFRVLRAGKDLDIEFVVRYAGNDIIYGDYYFNVLSYASTTKTTISTITTPTTTSTSTASTSTTTSTASVPTTTSFNPYPNVGLSNQSRHNYSEALRLSTMFYDAQRSGRLPPNNPVPWRRDSGLNDSDNGHDLTGGWYNGGDHVKFTMPMAFSTWVLEWGMYEFTNAYTSQRQNICNMIKWPLDYFLKCWVEQNQTLYVQVGETSFEHAYWLSPEKMPTERPAFKIDSTCKGSDVAADTVSALAAGFLVYRYVCQDSRYSYKLLSAAESLYKFAKNNRGLYSDCVTTSDRLYDSSNDWDEMSTAAAWLYKATYVKEYLNDAESFYKTGLPRVFSWNDVNVGAASLLYDITSNDTYGDDIKDFILNFLPLRNVTYTPCGLVWRDQWGPNRYAANAAFIALIAAKKGIQPELYKKFALSQINYILGDNNLNISYEIGYGHNYPLSPRHRASSCSGTSSPCMYLDPNPNPNILLGALVGGPDGNDVYTDKRTNYVQNEVALDFNAGFQSTLAGLVHFEKLHGLPSSPIRLC
ncbi:hypothetical protein ACF0H5_019809 [Mactra antiquata]